MVKKKRRADITISRSDMIGHLKDSIERKTLSTELPSDRVLELTAQDLDFLLGKLLQTTTELVAEGYIVQFRGFGSFKPVKRAARTARHINKDKPLRVPAKYAPIFTAGCEFKEVVATRRTPSDKN